MFLNLLSDAGDTPTNNTGTIILMVVVAVVFIGFFVWQSISNKKKQKQAQELLDQVRVGDKVKTIGGICGYIVEINKEENTFVMETGLNNNKSYIKLDRQAIYQTAHVDANGNVIEDKPAVKEEVKAEEVKEEKTEEKSEKKSSKKSAKKEQEKTEEVKEVKEEAVAEEVKTEEPKAE